MTRTYKATGINLKSIPMGEADRLLTILTREYGLVRAVAMGSRKYNSSLGGRSALFVINDLLIAKGRSLDKVAQAETLESYPRLSQDLKKLTASQYLAELCLYQALSDQPQEELFCLLSEHLKRLEQAKDGEILPHLTHAVFQLLVLAGVAPQVHLCCVTQKVLEPDFEHPDWRIGFSIPTGGVVTLEALEKLKADKPKPVLKSARQESKVASISPHDSVKTIDSSQPEKTQAAFARRSPSHLHIYLNATELALMQQLAQAELPDLADHQSVWKSIERVLRDYAQYYFDRPIRSATLVDVCFVATDHPLPF